MKECITTYWYNKKEDKFYVNLNNKNWVINTKELLKECAKCDDIMKCAKLNLFITLLSKNDL